MQFGYCCDIIHSRDSNRSHDKYCQHLIDEISAEKIYLKFLLIFIIQRNCSKILSIETLMVMFFKELLLQNNLYIIYKQATIYKILSNKSTFS